MDIGVVQLKGKPLGDQEVVALTWYGSKAFFFFF